MADARDKIERWRLDYNKFRPHSSLGDRTPSEFWLAHLEAGNLQLRLLGESGGGGQPAVRHRSGWISRSLEPLPVLLMDISIRHASTDILGLPNGIKMPSRNMMQTAQGWICCFETPMPIFKDSGVRPRGDDLSDKKIIGILVM